MIRLVLFVRHGQSIANAGDHAALDPELSELGRVQAQELWAQIVSFLPQLVLVSPLSRASETGCIAFELMPKWTTLKTEERCDAVAHGYDESRWEAERITAGGNRWDQLTQEQRAALTVVLGYNQEKWDRRRDIVLECVRELREGWWKKGGGPHDNPSNSLDPEHLKEVLKRYVRDGSPDNPQASRGVEEALCKPDPSGDFPERESIANLYDILAQFSEKRIVAVCHEGVIKSLCGANQVRNCAMVLCAFGSPGRFEVLANLPPPGSMGHAYVEVVKDEGCKYMKIGDRGFCTEDSVKPSSLTKVKPEVPGRHCGKCFKCWQEGDPTTPVAGICCDEKLRDGVLRDHVEVLFDNGLTLKPERDEMKVLFRLWDRVRMTRDSSDNGKWYKEGDTGIFLGPGFKPGRALILFDDGRTAHPRMDPESFQKIFCVESVDEPANDLQAEADSATSDMAGEIQAKCKSCGNTGTDFLTDKPCTCEFGKQKKAEADSATSDMAGEIQATCKSCGNTGTDFLGNPCSCGIASA